MSRSRPIWRRSPHLVIQKKNRWFEVLQQMNQSVLSLISCILARQSRNQSDIRERSGVVERLQELCGRADGASQSSGGRSEQAAPAAHDVSGIESNEQGRSGMADPARG